MIPCVLMHTFTSDTTTVFAFAEDDAPSADALEELVNSEGTYDWWYGEISDGVWAIVITTEDADGNLGNPDWSELPVVLKSHILAGLR